MPDGSATAAAMCKLVSHFGGGHNICNYAFNQVCRALLDRSVGELVNDLRLSNLMVVDDNAIENASAERCLSLVIGGELRQLSETMEAQCDFSKLPISADAMNKPCLALHKDIACVGQLATMMIYDERHVFAELQHDGETLAAITAPQMSSLLAAYSEVHTIMCVAATVQQTLQSGAFVLPNQANIIKAPAASSTTPPAPGVQPGLLQAMCILGTCAGSLQTLLAADAYKDFDSSSLGLRCSIGFCRQWASCMAAILSKFQQHMISLAATKLNDTSDTLESATPRWQVAFKGDTFDEGLARSRILNNSHRPIIKPTLDFAKRVKAQMLAALVAMNIEATSELTSAVAFAQTTAAHASEPLLITVALDTILVVRDQTTMSHMASPTLDIIARLCRPHHRRL